jgi:hypothetical protein
MCGGSCGCLSVGEHLYSEDWMVDTISLGQARDLVAQHHYARGSSNTATFRHGLFRRSEWPLVVSGAAIWIPPTRGAAEATLRQLEIEGDWRRVLSLSRFVISPEVPTNGASYLLGRSIRMIKQTSAWDVLVTYADERQGHTGGIYLATNWRYIGESVADSWVIDGQQVTRKAGPKTRNREEMEALGATELPPVPKRKFAFVL